MEDLENINPMNLFEKSVKKGDKTLSILSDNSP